MKTPEQIEHEQQYFDYIKTYQYIDEDGRLDLELFCCHLSTCFFVDGIPDLSPQPRDVYNLLIECLKEFEEHNTQKNWVQYQKLIDWTPEHAKVYPDKIRTYIHVAGLLHAHGHWIYWIGHELIGLPKSETDQKYYAWVNEEWTFVHTFIDGWHNNLFNFIKETDRKAIDERGYSMLEALHKSTKSNVGYDEALDSLKNRHVHHEEGIQRIKDAINEGFYLEAITLEECIISNYLNSFLTAKKIKLPNPTFATLLGKIKNRKFLKDEKHLNLFNDVNKWRKQRNLAIHGFVTAREAEASSSLDSFLSFAKNTAEMGIKHLEQVKKWYHDECVEYFEHRFPSQKSRPIS